MPDTKLAAELRSDSGSRPAGRLRREGLTPGIVYGLGGESVSVTVSAHQLGNILSSRTGANTLITLQIEGRDELALARQVQRDAVKGNADPRRLRAGARRPDDPGRGPIEPAGRARRCVAGRHARAAHAHAHRRRQAGPVADRDRARRDRARARRPAARRRRQGPGGRARHERSRRAHRHDLGAPWSRARRRRGCRRGGRGQGPRARKRRQPARPRTPPTPSRRSCCGAGRDHRRAPELLRTCSWSGSAIRARSTPARSTTSVPMWSSSSRAATAAGCARARSVRSSTRCAWPASGWRSRCRPPT